MFKKLSDMERSMCLTMNKIKGQNNIHSVLNNLCQDDRNALHECLKNKYVENISEYVDGNGYYHFQSLGNAYVSQLGFTFIRNMSLRFRIKNFVFEILKGTLGYILGVATPLTVEAIIWIAKNSECIQEFFLGILNK